MDCADDPMLHCIGPVLFIVSGQHYTSVNGGEGWEKEGLKLYPLPDAN